ncbi:hypothetical protein [Boseongicola sp. H5]|uniref:hypothetical protein n=1 Tax=Boseongicola sp. H5 TaxID=2763261 RepID=UPI001D0A201E|nr:hypothetical protein [Boseongicola sp. H5]
MSTLVITNAQIASALNIADSTFRCARLLSAPRDLPFDRIPGVHSGQNRQRGYHLQPVLEWLRRICPERLTPEVERRMYAFAAQNLQATEAA